MAYHDSAHTDTDTDTGTDTDYRKLACPQCGLALIRIQRRAIDRIISLFSPVQRFRCRNHSCQWQGNIKAQHTFSGATRSSSRL